MEINKYEVKYQYRDENGELQEKEMKCYITENEIQEKMQKEEIGENESIKRCVERFVNVWVIEELEKITEIIEKDTITV